MSRNDRPGQCFVRLNLESLEARDNPADYGWAPIDGIYSTTAVNWLKGPGIPYARYTVYDYAPRAGDNLFFVGTLSNADCIIPQYGGGQPMPPPPGVPPVPPPPPPVHAGDSFNSITSQDGYAGSVEAGRDLQVNLLEWGSGYLAQKNTTDLYQSGNTHAGDFTVSGEFLWTGGGINYGSRAPVHNGHIVPGKFNLAPTATGLAEPTNGGTVQLGSTVTLLGNESAQTGSTLDMIGGKFDVYRGQFVVTAFSHLFLISDKKADPLKATITITDKGGTQTPAMLSVNANGTATVTTNREPGAEDTPGEKMFVGKRDSGIISNKGTIDIKNRSVLIAEEVNGATVGGAYLQDTASGDERIPTTRLETDSEIRCVGQSVITFTTGRLEVPRRVVGGNPAAGEEAVLTAKYVSLKEAASIEMPGTWYNRLKIDGQFLYDGNFFAAISRTSTKCDHIVATGEVIVTENKAKLTVRWGNSDARTATQWAVVESKAEEILKTPQFDDSGATGGGPLMVNNDIDEKILHVQRRMD